MYHLRSLEAGEDITAAHQGDSDANGEVKKGRRMILREESVKSYEILKQGTDGLIMVCKQHPSNLLKSLFEYLKPSRPFVVFSPYKEPLVQTFLEIKQGGKAINVTLSESWLRNLQVLENRTHPEVMMSGGGGYILTGLKVKNDISKNSNKRLKTE